MRSKREIVPVYLVMGFLESGKTTLINSMLEDQGFSDGIRTLIISCEEGMEEYDSDLMNEAHAAYVQLEEKEEFTTRKLIELDEKYRPERVILEYNTVWGVDFLGGTGMPAMWRVAQIIALADANTFDNYMTNMRQMLTDPMKQADLILVNRCRPEHPKSQWRRQMKAFNNRANIIFENVDGTSEDGVADEDLPYDMKAAVIDIREEDFGTFYMDSMDHPERYDHKTVRLVGQAYPDRAMPKGFYLFGRLAMTCCANDIAQIGWVCQGVQKPNARQFIRLTAQCTTATDGRDTIVMMHEVRCEPAEAPKEKYVTFN